VAAVKTHSNALVAGKGIAGSVSVLQVEHEHSGCIEDNQDVLGSEELCKALVRTSRGPNTSLPLTPG
jgi:hypothetical protein